MPFGFLEVPLAEVELNARADGQSAGIELIKKLKSRGRLAAVEGQEIRRGALNRGAPLADAGVARFDARLEEDMDLVCNPAIGQTRQRTLRLVHQQMFVARRVLEPHHVEKPTGSVRKSTGANRPVLRGRQGYLLNLKSRTRDDAFHQRVELLFSIDDLNLHATSYGRMGELVLSSLDATNRITLWSGGLDVQVLQTANERVGAPNHSRHACAFPPRLARSEEVEGGPVGEDLVQSDSQLQTGKMRAHAVMLAETEAQMRVSFPIPHQLIRQLERRRIAVHGPEVKYQPSGRRIT